MTGRGKLEITTDNDTTRVSKVTAGTHELITTEDNAIRKNMSRVLKRSGRSKGSEWKN